VADLWGIISINGFVLANIGAVGTVTDKSGRFEADTRQRSQSDQVTLKPRDYHLVISNAPKTGLNAELLVAALDIGGDAWPLVATSQDNVTVSITVAAKDLTIAGGYQVRVTAIDPIWREVVPQSWSKTFSSPNDQALALTVGGRTRIPPRIVIQPTVQRTTPTAQVGWRYRTRVTITNNAPEPLVDYETRIPIGTPTGNTAALVTAGKADASGNGLRVFDDQGRNVPRELVNWNTTTNSAVWFLIKRLDPFKTMTVDVVYGNNAAGLPPSFAYSKTDPTQTSMLDLANSSMTVRAWAVSRILANAYRGLWYTEVGGTPDHNVPSSWDRTTFYENKDDFEQDTFSTFVVTGSTYGYAVFRVNRFKHNASGIPDNRNRLFDGVMFYSPVGIISIETDFDITNTLDGTPANTSAIGRVEIWARNAGRDFRQIWMDRARRGVALGNNIVTPGVLNVQANGENARHVAFSGGPFDGVAIPRNADATLNLDVRTNTICRVNLPDLVGIVVSAEEEIVDYVGTIRFGGGPDPAPIAPRQEVIIGAGTTLRHLLIPYRGGGAAADKLIITTDGGLTAALWSADEGTKQQDVGWAVSALSVEPVEGGGSVTRRGRLPVLMPKQERVTNTTFATGITGWAGEGNTAGMTAATSWDSTTPALQIAVTANTGGTGEWARANFLTDLAVSPSDPIVVAVDVRSTTLTMWGEIELAWKTAAGVDISSDFSPSYVPGAINTPYRRVVGAIAPPTAGLVRLRIRARPVAAGNTGTVRFKNIDTTGNEVLLIDDTDAALALTVSGAKGVV
jgi:hypothetical protein